MRHARGQALVETALVMPLFVLALYGTIWEIRAGVLSERVQSTVRNANIVLTHRDPLHDYSLLSAYNGMYNGSGASAPVPCASPTAQPLSASSAMNGKAGTPFFSPVAGSFTAACNVVKGANPLISYTGSALLSGDVMLIQNDAQASAGVSVPAYLRNVLPMTTRSAAEFNFFRPPAILTMTTCVPGYNDSFTSTIDPTSDRTTPNVVATPFPAALPFGSGGQRYGASCTTQVGAASAPVAPPAPTATPVPPTPVPTAAPGSGSITGGQVPPPGPSSGTSGSTGGTGTASGPTASPPTPTPPNVQYYNGGGGGAIN